MRIVHLITRLILGGAQENTVLSCQGLARRGHEVTLAFGPIYGPEGSLLDQARRGGYACVELPAMRRAVNPWSDWQCYRQCRGLIRRLEPDVVHTHSSKAGIVGRAAAWAEGTPAVVHTIHGLPFHPRQNALANRMYVAAERWAARRCHAIVSVAEAMTRQALAAGVGRAEQYSTIHSGMEVEPFLDDSIDRAAVRRSLGLRDEWIVLGTAARLAELKGHDDLLEALGPMLRARQELRLLWVGDGWLRPRLERRIAAMGLADRIVITGMRPPEQMPGLMRAMDVLIHPSYREGLARALPQALLCGVPAISYDSDGASEVCIHGQTGRLVPTGDRNELADAVRWMLEHRSEWKAMGLAGRALCRKRFAAATMVEGLEALYQRLTRH
jgi:glycosyltransferase involved in cell wall biosynthesis